MNDKDKTINLLDPIYVFLAIHITSLNEVFNLIGKNQNGPPDGEADGSFTVEQWIAARDAHNALQIFRSTMETLKQ